MQVEISVLSVGKDLFFKKLRPFILWLQVLFAGEKIGEGFGRTRREAQSQAAEGSLRNLAGKVFYCCLYLCTFLPLGTLDAFFYCLGVETLCYFKFQLVLDLGHPLLLPLS